MIFYKLLCIAEILYNTRYTSYIKVGKYCSRHRNNNNNKNKKPEHQEFMTLSYRWHMIFFRI
jgi:hypothetical protein